MKRCKNNWKIHKMYKFYGRRRTRVKRDNPVIYRAGGYQIPRRAANRVTYRRVRP